MKASLRIFAAGFLIAVASAESPPKIIARSDWAKKPIEIEHLKPMGVPKFISVHETGVGTLRGDGSAAGELNVVLEGHMASDPSTNKGRFGDIAYHFLIAPSGEIFQGRSLEYQTNSNTRYYPKDLWMTTPLHSADQTAKDPKNFPLGGVAYKPESATGPKPGHVDRHITVCFIGEFSKDPPTKEAKSAFISLCAYLMKKHSIPIQNVMMHREVASTSCPGDKVYLWLRKSGTVRYALGEGLLELQRQQ